MNYAMLKMSISAYLSVMCLMYSASSLSGQKDEKSEGIRTNVRAEMEQLLDTLSETETEQLAEKLHLKLLSQHSEACEDEVSAEQPETLQGKKMLAVVTAGGVERRKRSPPGGGYQRRGSTGKHSDNSEVSKNLLGGVSNGHKTIVHEKLSSIIKTRKQKRSVGSMFSENRKKPSYYAPDHSTSEDNISHHRSKRSFLVNWEVLKEVLGWDKRSSQPELVYFTAKVEDTQYKEHFY